MSISITEYNRKDKPDCLRLLRTIFSGTSDEHTFRWRFESLTPYPPIMICAKDEDKVISFNSWLPWKFAFNKMLFSGFQSGESATYPEYRRKGILGKVLRYADEIAAQRNIDFLFGFPSPMIYSTFYKSGYYPIDVLPYRLRFINPFGERIRDKESDEFANLSFDALIQPDKITPYHNMEYIQWRYEQNPKHYDTLKYEENNNLALFVLRPSTYYNKKYRLKLDELLLLDCHFTSYNKIFIRNAFRHLDKTYRGKALFLRGFFSENTDRGRVLCKNFHFTIKSRYEIFCIKPIRKDLDRSIFFNYNNWDILPHVVDEM